MRLLNARQQIIVGVRNELREKLPVLPEKTNNAPPHQTRFREIITRSTPKAYTYGVPFKRCWKSSLEVGAAIGAVPTWHCRGAAAAFSRLRRGFVAVRSWRCYRNSPPPSFSLERCPHDVSNVPSNITMTVIAALINADTAARRQPVTPLGFNAILSGVALRIVAVGGCIAYVPTTLLRGFVAPLPFVIRYPLYV